MKKIIALALTLALCLGLMTACGAGEKSGALRVAVVQQMDHASLDEIREAICAQLEAGAAQRGLTLEVETFNGQNDPTVLNQIGAQVVGDGYDLLLPIATTAAQCMATAAEGTEIPIVFAAISDPAAAGLDGLSHVTGVSDALETGVILDLMLTLQPEVKTVGLLYSNSEPNSATPIAQAKAYLEEKGIAYLEKTGNTTDEIVSAANSLVGRVDAVFTPTDNVVMGAEGAVAEILAGGGIPHYAGADSFVYAGAFATCGVNYTDLGTQAADMALDILAGGEISGYKTMEGGILTVNKAVAQQLGLDYGVLKDRFPIVKEVETGEG